MASAGDGGRLGTEPSVPAFSRTSARTKGGIFEKRRLTGTPECLLERLAHTRDMLPQGIVDEALVVAAALLDQRSKPGDYILLVLRGVKTLAESPIGQPATMTHASVTPGMPGKMGKLISLSHTRDATGRSSGFQWNVCS